MFPDPDRYIQSSVHGKRCMSKCTKDIEQKFYYCVTSPWLMKFDHSKHHPLHVEEKLLDWDLCTHKHYMKPEIGNNLLELFLHSLIAF